MSIYIVSCNKGLYSLAAIGYTQKDRFRPYPPSKQDTKPQSYSVNKAGHTQLHQAVIDVNKEAVESILSGPPSGLTKAFINHKDKKGYTALQWCIDTHILAKLTPIQAEDYLYILKRLLKHPQSDLSILDDYGRSILHWAVIGKYVEAVKTIFDEASKNDMVKTLINQKDSFGYPPLHYLVMHESEEYSEKQSAILEACLGSTICDINAKDFDRLPALYWLIKYKQPKLAAKILASDRLETFPEFICNAFNEYYPRLHYLQKLSDDIRNILNESATYLTNIDQIDPDITDTKKLLAEKYLGLGRDHPPIQTSLDILCLIKKTIACDEQSDPISILQPGRFDVQSDLTTALKGEELDKTIDLILASGDFDKNIKLSPDPKEYESKKALKDFLEGICKALPQPYKFIASDVECKT